MGFKLAIRNNATREVRLATIDVNWSDDTLFWLSEGNASCDCVREVWFLRADEEGTDQSQCGDDRFSILYAELEGGSMRVQVDEDDEDALSPPPRPTGTAEACIGLIQMREQSDQPVVLYHNARVLKEDG